MSSPLKHSISINGSILTYFSYGNGPHVLLYFHGFGQGHGDFPAQDLNTFTIYSFDLFFHGESHWRKDHPLEFEDWALFMGEFFDKTAINQCAIAGFSLGARFALATWKAFPEKIHHVFLLAPDGLRFNFWYWLATWPWPTRKLFKTMVDRPNLFFKLAEAAAKAKWINPRLIRFTESQMDTREKRSRVFDSWTTFRHLIIPTKTLVSLARNVGTPITLVAGCFDIVAPSLPLKKMFKATQEIKFVEMEASHKNLIQQYFPLLMDSIKTRVPEGKSF